MLGVMIVRNSVESSVKGRPQREDPRVLALLGVDVW